MVQVEGPPPEVVTLGRTNNFDAATYSGTGNWLPTADSPLVDGIILNNQIRYNSSFGGGSFQFDGSATFEGPTFGATSGGENTVYELSVEAWYFRIPSNGGISITSYNPGDVSWFFDDGCSTQWNPDDPFTTDSLSMYSYLVPGAWNQVVMTFGGGAYPKAYVNGVLVATSTIPSGMYPQQATAPILISASEGSIAIIRAYDRIITDAEVLQNYNAVKSRFTYTLSSSVTTTGLTNYFDAAPSGVSPSKYNGVGYDNSGVWQDQVGSLDMTLTNSPAYDSSTAGGQFSFLAASTQYASTTAGLSLTNDMTIEIWFKSGTLVSQTGAPLMTLFIDSNNFPLQLRNISTGTANYNRFALSYKTAGTYTNSGVTTQLPINTWYQVIIVKTGGYGGTVKRVFRSTTLTGIYTQTNNYNYPNTSDLASMRLMTDSGTLRRNGSIGLVRIYNTALTNAELLQNYNATKARFGLA